MTDHGKLPLPFGRQASYRFRLQTGCRIPGVLLAKSWDPIGDWPPDGPAGVQSALRHHGPSGHAAPHNGRYDTVSDGHDGAVHIFPMHLQVRQTDPGICPICGLGLELESAIVGLLPGTLPGGWSRDETGNSFSVRTGALTKRRRLNRLPKGTTRPRYGFGDPSSERDRAAGRFDRETIRHAEPHRLVETRVTDA